MVMMTARYFDASSLFPRGLRSAVNSGLNSKATGTRFYREKTLKSTRRPRSGDIIPKMQRCCCVSFFYNGGEYSNMPWVVEPEPQYF